MWISVSELSRILGVTSRSIQLAIKNNKVVARKKDQRSYEVDTSSLPSEWKTILPEEVKNKSLSPVLISNTSNTPITTLGYKLSGKEKIKAEIVNFFNSLDPLLPITAREQITASNFNVSLSSVRRYKREIEEFGVLGRRSERETLKNWSVEAEEFLKGWYLSFLRQTNKDSKIAAYNAVCTEGIKRGWKVGSRSSAYEILNEIPELVKRYAIAGNRALDNHFYIKRDWSNLLPAQILIGDQHICDFWVADYSNPEKPEYYRPELYVWQDAATRCIAGIAVDKTYSSDTVLEALRMAISRFGFFDCTYNDNGSSECSKAATAVIDELIMLSNNRSRMRDISDLYKAEDGTYVVENQDGDIVGHTDSEEKWRRQHRRIYANVKNAKTKPIERLFGTIEEKMAQHGVPGHVKTPGAPADQEEKEEAVLESQKKKGLILTLDQFIWELMKGIDEYEHTKHSSLDSSPWECVEKHIALGWIAKKPNPDELDFIFLNKTKAKVKKGRVTVNKIDYIGEDLKVSSGDFVDVGLHLHEGKTVEIRYNKFNPDVCYAVIPNSKMRVRPLKRVEAITMLDDEKMEEKIKWKRNQMKVVREIFNSLASPSSISVDSPLTSQIGKAKERLIGAPPEKVNELLNIPILTNQKAKPSFHSDFERYRWILSQIKKDEELEESDISFKEKYEASVEYNLQKSYWKTFLDMEE